MLEGVKRLQENIERLEQDIATETENMKALYGRAASLMPEQASYYLNGVQTSSVVKAYLLTNRGVAVQGEAAVPIGEFIDTVMRYANYPDRKIKVLADLADHLEKIHSLIGVQEAH